MNTEDPNDLPSGEHPPVDRPPTTDAEASAAVDAGGPEVPPARTIVSRRSPLREYFEAFLIAVIAATFAKTFVVQAFKIPTGSMEENLLIGDHILVNKFVYGPTSGPLERLFFPQEEIERGDVVVFKFPEDPSRDFIKRCVGLPGDKVEVIDQHLYINDHLVEDSSYVFYNPHNRYRQHYGPATVAEGEFFCMGDNRDNSRDSRSWGGVPAAFVKGRAFMIYWSYDAERQSLEWTGYWDKIRQLAGVTRGFFTNTRWNRSFTIVR